MVLAKIVMDSCHRVTIAHLKPMAPVSLKGEGVISCQNNQKTLTCLGFCDFYEEKTSSHRKQVNIT